MNWKRKASEEVTLRDLRSTFNPKNFPEQKSCHNHRTHSIF